MAEDIKLTVAGMTLAKGVVLVNKEAILARGGAGEVLVEDHYEPRSSGVSSGNVGQENGHSVTRVVRSRSSTGTVASETYFNLTRRRTS